MYCLIAARDPARWLTGRSPNVFHSNSSSSNEIGPGAKKYFVER